MHKQPRQKKERSALRVFCLRAPVAEPALIEDVVSHHPERLLGRQNAVTVQADAQALRNGEVACVWIG